MIYPCWQSILKRLLEILFQMIIINELLSINDPVFVAQHHAHYIHHSHFQQDSRLPHYKLDQPPQSLNPLHPPKLPTIYSGPPTTTSENNTESDSEEEDDGGRSLGRSSTSDCGECCGGHAPYPCLSPRSPNIIPATMCKATQISPTTVIEMYAASVRRNGAVPSKGGLQPLMPPVTTVSGPLISSSKPPNGFHVPCPVAPMPAVKPVLAVVNSARVVNKNCPQHGSVRIQAQR